MKNNIKIKIIIKSLKKNQEKRRDVGIGEHKLNETGVLNMKKIKWNKLEKSKRSWYSPVIFKHDCSLETFLELWKKNSNTSAFVFFKKFQGNSDMHLDFKKWLQVFLLELWWYRVLLFFCWPTMIQVLSE